MPNLPVFKMSVCYVILNIFLGRIQFNFKVQIMILATRNVKLTNTLCSIEYIVPSDCSTFKMLI